jgi:hypothetical protein
MVFKQELDSPFEKSKFLINTISTGPQTILKVHPPNINFRLALSVIMPVIKLHRFVPLYQWFPYILGRGVLFRAEIRRGVLSSVAYPGIVSGAGGGLHRKFFSGGSTNSVEDRGQREWGPGGSSPLVRGSSQFAYEWNPVVTDVYSTELRIRLSFGKTSELRGFEPPNLPSPSVRHWLSSHLNQRHVRMCIFVCFYLTVFLKLLVFYRIARAWIIFRILNSLLMTPILTVEGI